MTTDQILPERPTWEQHALNIAFAASLRSEDPWVKVGACILRADNTVASVGYNGAPAGISIPWHDRDSRRPYVIHAEMNALRSVSAQEISGGLIAVTHHPCAECLKSLTSYGIRRVVYATDLEWGKAYDLEQIYAISTAFNMRMEKLSVFPFPIIPEGK